MSLEFILGIIGVLLIIGIAVLYMALRRRSGFSPAQRHTLQQRLRQIQGRDADSAIFAYDKLLGEALGMLGHKGTVHQRIQGYARRHPDTARQMHRAHHVRNQLAHDHHEPTAKAQADASAAFERIFRQLLETH